MTLAELVERLHLETGLTRQVARAVLDETFAAIGSDAIRGGRTVIPGFGSFTLRTRKARRIAGPPDALGCSTTPMQLPRMITVGFRAARALKDKANRGRR